MSRMSALATALLLVAPLCCPLPASADHHKSDEGFVSLFDGESMKGWKTTEENPGSWKVVDGQLVAEGPRSHLFYVGELAPFENFHFKADVMTTPGSNAGIYFHTQYQPEGWPRHGFEVQVNVSHKDPKKSGSLYAVQNVDDPGVKDNQWYTQEIIVQGNKVTTKINGKTMVEYIEPEDQQAFNDQFERRLSEGTFALQAHDPDSKVFFKNLKVKKLD